MRTYPRGLCLESAVFASTFPIFSSLSLAGCQGFDEYMNLVLDDAEEVYMKKKLPKKPIGRILLKGENITLMQVRFPCLSKKKKRSVSA